MLELLWINLICIITTSSSTWVKLLRKLWNSLRIIVSKFISIILDSLKVLLITFRGMLDKIESLLVEFCKFWVVIALVGWELCLAFIRIPMLKSFIKFWYCVRGIPEALNEKTVLARLQKVVENPWEHVVICKVISWLILRSMWRAAVKIIRVLHIIELSRFLKLAS